MQHLFQMSVDEENKRHITLGQARPRHWSRARGQSEGNGIIWEEAWWCAIWIRSIRYFGEQDEAEVPYMELPCDGTRTIKIIMWFIQGEWIGQVSTLNHYSVCNSRTDMVYTKVWCEARYTVSDRAWSSGGWYFRGERSEFTREATLFAAPREGR